MKREARDFRETAPKPVERIPVEIKRPGLRLLLVIAALAIASGAFFYGFRRLTSVEAGWVLLEADGASGVTAADDFQLLVELGAGQESALTERRRLVSVYSGAARDAYTLYTSAEYVAGVNNLWYINHHPGEEIVLDARLYRAVEKSLQSGPWLYLGSLYETWDSVYFSREDREAAAADPRGTPETADYLKQAAELIRNGEIRLELRGENRVCLTLTDRILAFGKEYGVTRWLDFGWQKNAFIADDLADALTAAGWTRAVLSSGDGFIRCLDGRGAFALNLYADTDTGIRQIAELGYSGPASLLMLLPSPGGSRSYSYRYQDGVLRTAWISAENGLDVRPADGVAALSDQEGCADLLCRFLTALTGENTSDDEWAAAADGCALWLVRNGVPESLGNDRLTVLRGDS